MGMLREFANGIIIRNGRIEGFIEGRSFPGGTKVHDGISLLHVVDLEGLYVCP